MWQLFTGTSVEPRLIMGTSRHYDVLRTNWKSSHFLCFTNSLIRPPRYTTTFSRPEGGRINGVPLQLFSRLIFHPCSWMHVSCSIYNIKKKKSIYNMSHHYSLRCKRFSVVFAFWDESIFSLSSQFPCVQILKNAQKPHGNTTFTTVLLPREVRPPGVFSSLKKIETLLHHDRVQAKYMYRTLSVSPQLRAGLGQLIIIRAKGTDSRKYGKFPFWGSTRKRKTLYM